MVARAPLSGYNHNIRYKERVYHVQTEDSGLENPHVLTHLFLNGMVVSSLRCDYRHLVQDPENAEKVRKIMQDQHKQLMKNLRRGELNDQIMTLVGTMIPGEVLAAPEPAAPVLATPPSAAPAPAQPVIAPPIPAAQPPPAARAPAPPPAARPLQPEVTPGYEGKWDDQLLSTLPIFEFEEGSADALDLDIEAISNMDLDAVPEESSVKLSAWVQSVLEEMAKHAPVGSGEELELAEVGDEDEFLPRNTPIQAVELEEVVVESKIVPRPDTTPPAVIIDRRPTNDTMPMPALYDEFDPTKPDLPAPPPLVPLPEPEVPKPEKQTSGVYDVPDDERTDVIDTGSLHGFDPKKSPKK